MSSLIRCTDDLLHQKAVQSSHYERLERQLLDGERCRRAAVLALRQRVADVKRRGKDVVDLRRENHQLADQLAQHALQLAALQCRNAESKKRESAAVEQLQDGIRSFSGHPARIALLVQALQAQKQLHCAGRRFSNELQMLWGLLCVRRRALVFVAHSTRVLSVHAALHVRLTSALRDRVTRCSEMREAAGRRTEIATAARVDRVISDQQAAERLLLSVNAEAGLLSVYAEALDGACGAAEEEVAALSAAIDKCDERLSAIRRTLQENEAAVAEAKRSLTAQQTAHAEASTLHEMQVVRAAEELSAAAADEEAANSHAEELQRSVQVAEQDTELLARRVYALAFLLLLCEQEQLRLSRQCAEQAEEKAKTELELAQLRRWHEERLERLRASRAAAANRAARDALLSKEAHDRKATLDLERDEWRLLYAQLVRDACRARAEASAAAAAAPVAKRARRAPVAGGREAVERVLSARPPRRKRARAEGRPHVTATAASRRQRSALEAVDALNLASSQHSSIGYLTTTPACEEAAAAELTSQQHRSGAAHVMANMHATPLPPSTASSTLRLSYRLTSVKPAAVAKKPIRAPPAVPESLNPVPDKKRKADARVTAAAGDVQHTPTTAAAHASAISPFTSAVGEESSDSSFSLVRNRKSAAAEADTGSDISDVRLYSPSPSPRCPPGRHAAAGPPTAAAHPLPRPVRRQGCGEAALATAHRVSGSALASALAACTPRSTAIGGSGDRTSAHSSSFPSHFTGNFAALPGVRGGTRLPHKSKAVRLPRRRAPLLAAAAADLGEDLFADMFL
ncbi:hypothetical protein conserved [Leishmania donovani]|uniref:Uncharacterized protein n=3 Tax=Leishmania donovani species complex TaxID=38574 RepID=A4HW75_LEIIN|nr:conserved hypothetical protein [Leishmania infantum JPCM5]CAC9470101.1 hypothetical_protein_-_conserved [Leishmania infantum]CAJ1987404.1 hypothetical protein conserved [Leishmania donovani]CAM66697.1 conserved hypothetical protein [Leishmania infantum JPCM5]SUZ40369.1 hypothetical_protein_-_conserved [Leishmania infantum]VDZ43292.1 hypothetical_protein_conserved [Leishmania donovani]|eukprot:XP_001464316.1 conserved hypothetical protein [Leishmania infantum JPCM5]